MDVVSGVDRHLDMAILSIIFDNPTHMGAVIETPHFWLFIDSVLRTA